MNLNQLRHWLAHHRKATYSVLILCSGTLGGSIGIFLAPLFGR